MDNTTKQRNAWKSYMHVTRILIKRFWDAQGWGKEHLNLQICNKKLWLNEKGDKWIFIQRIHTLSVLTDLGEKLNWNWEGNSEPIWAGVRKSLRTSSYLQEIISHTSMYIRTRIVREVLHVCGGMHLLILILCCTLGVVHHTQVSCKNSLLYIRADLARARHCSLCTCCLHTSVFWVHILFVLHEFLTTSPIDTSVHQRKLQIMHVYFLESLVFFQNHVTEDWKMYGFWTVRSRGEVESGLHVQQSMMYMGTYTCRFGGRIWCRWMWLQWLRWGGALRGTLSYLGEIWRLRMVVNFEPESAAVRRNWKTDSSLQVTQMCIALCGNIIAHKVKLKNRCTLLGMRCECSLEC